MTDDILIHISLSAILRGCAGESFSCSVMLFDLGYFLKLGVGEKFDTRGFSW